VFTVVTAASFSAGALQHQFGWDVVNIGVLPPILIVLAAVLWLKARGAGTELASTGASSGK
jgi:hypothetical protein